MVLLGPGVMEVAKANSAVAVRADRVRSNMVWLLCGRCQWKECQYPAAH